MSSRTTLITLCCLVIASFTTWKSYAPSTSGKQLSFNQESVAGKLRVTNKLGSHLKLTLRPSNSADYEAGRNFGLTVEIASDVDLQNVELEWILPAEASLVSGSLKQTVLEVKSGEVQTVEIVINSPSSENARVHVNAAVMENNIRFNETAHYNTVLQKQIDEQIAALAQRTKDSVDSQNSRLKIFK